jgi:NAD(P)-dependent dehydrogenase (short-subunit alcohol dehydrogenase family)
VDTRTAIVTGASSGIGLALAQAYQSRHRRDPSLDLDATDATELMAQLFAGTDAYFSKYVSTGRSLRYSD